MRIISTYQYTADDGSMGVGVTLEYDSTLSGHEVDLYWEHGKLVGGTVVEYGEWRDLEPDECWERWGDDISEFQWEIQMAF